LPLERSLPALLRVVEVDRCRIERLGVEIRPGPLHHHLVLNEYREAPPALLSEAASDRIDDLVGDLLSMIARPSSVVALVHLASHLG
jgi:hypothetical protein